eukprot:1773537-Rhodomonas_salina.2
MCVFGGTVSKALPSRRSTNSARVPHTPAAPVVFDPTKNSPSPPPRGVARLQVQELAGQLPEPDGTAGTPDTKHSSRGPTGQQPLSRAGAQSTSPDEAPAEGLGRPLSLPRRVCPRGHPVASEWPTLSCREGRRSLGQEGEGRVRQPRPEAADWWEGAGRGVCSLDPRAHGMPVTSGATAVRYPMWLPPSAPRPGSPNIDGRGDLCLGHKSVPGRQGRVHGDPVGERMNPKQSSVIQSPIWPGCSPAQGDNSHSRPDAVSTAYRHPHPFAHMPAVIYATEDSALRRARNRVAGMPNAVHPDSAQQLSVVGLEPCYRNGNERPNSTQLCCQRRVGVLPRFVPARDHTNQHRGRKAALIQGEPHRPAGTPAPIRQPGRRWGTIPHRGKLVYPALRLRPLHRDATQRDGPSLVSLLRRHDGIECLQQGCIGLSRGPEPGGPGGPLSPLTGRRKEQLFDQCEAPGPEPVQPLLDTPHPTPPGWLCPRSARQGCPAPESALQGPEPRSSSSPSPHSSGDTAGTLPSAEHGALPPAHGQVAPQ